MFVQSFLLLSSFVIAASQKLSNEYLNPTNYTNEGVNSDNSETRQTDLWLLSRDGPVPVELNRGWSPENGYPGVQTVTSLHRGAYGYRLRGSQSPIAVVQDHPVQPRVQDALISSPGTANAHNVPNLERSFLNFQDPDSVLVELPIELASGFWERPRPNIIQELSSGRRLISTDSPGILQFDSSIGGNTEQDQTINAFQPNREATSRLPVTSSQQASDTTSQSDASYGIPYQTFDPSPIDSSNHSSNVPPATREDTWFPVHGRTASSVSPVDLAGNDDKLLYQISFEPPSQTTAQDNLGLTLTPDDIDILERLGILSFLNLEGMEPSNRNETSSVENSQREYDNPPHLIDNGGQSYTFIPEGRYGTNLSEVVFIEIPEFTSSQYHGNIPGNAERLENVRPIPYVISGSLETTEGTFPNNETSLNSPVFNGTSLTSEQIQDILQFLGLNNLGRANETTIQHVTLNNAEVTTTLAEPEIVARNLEPSTPITNISAVKNIESINLTDASTSKASLQEREEDPAVVTEEDRNASSLGLVSSGRIQPRILEKVEGEASETENEVLQLISRRMSSASAQKLEMLRKLMTKPKPYVFGYMQNDGNGTVQHRDETADGSGSIKGTYGYRDALGVYRNVSYIADDNGFHAVVRTNEPGTISHNPADAVFMSELPPQAAIAQMMAYIKRNNSFSSNT